MLQNLLILLVSLTAASPAYAGGGGVPLPEPSSMLLLAMGVTGVAIGRRLSNKRPDE